MGTYFISDLHLGHDQTLLDLFTKFLNDTAIRADAIYILGDLFETWIGDDYRDATVQSVIDALAAVTKKGIPVYVLTGNRDFLLSQSFMQVTGCQLLASHCCAEIYGKRIVLCHGDTLCLSDHAYQRFRKISHWPWLQFLYRQLPLSSRQRISDYARNQSKGGQFIVDIDESTLIPLLEQFNASMIIHGHTHQPCLHVWQAQQWYTRVVLSDWATQGNYLLIRENGQQQLAYFE